MKKNILMNDIFKKLARESGLAYADDFGTGFPEIKYPPGSEKFFELIVNECIGSLNKMASDPTYTEDTEFDSGWDLGVEDSISEIKKVMDV
jgi:hypothetical protein